MSKELLRQSFIEKRQQLADLGKEEASKHLFYYLKKISKKYSKVFSFINFKSEINLAILNDYLLKENKLYLPAIENDLMQFYHISSLDGLKRSAFGFLQPDIDKTSPANADETTLILVPGLAYDLYGHRLGYGKGHYDVFFALNPIPKKIGIGYQEQLYFDPFPHEVHDQTLDAIFLF